MYPGKYAAQHTLFSGCSTGNSKQSLVASIHFEKQIHTNFENLLELRHLHGHISNDAGHVSELSHNPHKMNVRACTCMSDT